MWSGRYRSTLSRQHTKVQAAAQHTLGRAGVSSLGARPQPTAKAQAECAPVSFLLHSYLGPSYSKMQSGLYNLNIF